MATSTTTQTAVGYGKTSQALWLATANFVSFGITMIMSAILSRHLPTSEYGTFRQVLYVYSTLLMVFSLGLPKAYSYFLARIPVDEGLDLVRKLTLIFLALASIFSFILFFGAGFISSVLGNPMLDDNLRLFAIVPSMLMPVLGVENILVVYRKASKVLLYVLISRIFTVTCTTLPVIAGGLGVKGAVGGFACASIITCIAGLILSRTPFKKTKNNKCNLSLRSIFNFSLPVFYSGIYGFIIASSSQFFVSRYFGVDEFAIFANGYHELPFASMVIGAVAGTLLPEFSRMYKEKKENTEFLALWKNVVAKSAMIIYPLSGFFFIYAPEIVKFLYGEGYVNSATLFRIITIVNIARIVPYSPFLFAVGKGRIFANIHLVTALSMVSLQYLCVSLFPSIEAIALIATSCTVLCLAAMLRSVAHSLESNIPGIMPWSFLLKTLLATGLSGSISVLITDIAGFGNNIVALLCSFLTFSLVYLPVARLLGINYITLAQPFFPFTKIRRII